MTHDKNITCTNCDNCSKLWSSPTPTFHKEREELKAEAAVFFDLISKYLPKSQERAALGDEKIYQAFYQAFVEFRPHIQKSAYLSALAAVQEKLDELTHYRNDEGVKELEDNVDYVKVSALSSVSEHIEELKKRA